MNYKNRIKEFIKGEIWKISNSKSSITDYWGGYKQALIDIECIIMDIDNENELIGKYGYFWDDENQYVAYYSKLINIDPMAKKSEVYRAKGNWNNEIGYQNFSLTIPKHIK